jgi:hypothetical protein
VLVLHDAEGVACLLVDVGQQLEWKLLLGLAGLLRVEVEDPALAALVREPERAAAGAGKTEVGYRLAERFQRF